MLERKSRFLSQFGPFLPETTLALPISILYKRGLIGISARAKTLSRSTADDALRQHP
jgi:hypothetical protein